MTPKQKAQQAFLEGKWSTDNPYVFCTSYDQMRNRLEWRDEFFRLLEEWAQKGQEE